MTKKSVAIVRADRSKAVLVRARSRTGQARMKTTNPATWSATEKAARIVAHRPRGTSIAAPMKTGNALNT